MYGNYFLLGVGLAELQRKKKKEINPYKLKYEYEKIFQYNLFYYFSGHIVYKREV